MLYPPRPPSRYRFQELGDFWLSVNRLYPEKRIELQLAAVRRRPSAGLQVGGGAPGPRGEARGGRAPRRRVRRGRLPGADAGGDRGLGDAVRVGVAGEAPVPGRPGRGGLGGPGGGGG